MVYRTGATACQRLASGVPLCGSPCRRIVSYLGAVFFGFLDDWSGVRRQDPIWIGVSLPDTEASCPSEASIPCNKHKQSSQVPCKGTGITASWGSSNL